MYPDGDNRTGAVDWLRDNCPVKDLLIITNGCTPTGGAVKIPDMFDEDRDGWIVRHVRPKGMQGLLHAGLLLFRTESLLRVVIIGGNLNKQPDLDRDGIWCQDFKVVAPRLPQPEDDQTYDQHAARGAAAAAAAAAAAGVHSANDSAGRFGSRLRQFVDYINPACRPEQTRQTPTGLRRRIQQVGKRYFSSVFIQNVSFCKDRLGTNIGKPQKRVSTVPCSCRCPT